MKNQRTSKSAISRRKFITKFGLAAGASALLPIIPPFVPKRSVNTTSLFKKDHPLTLGILLPPSNVYPAMGENLLAGISLYFERTGNQVSGREIVLRCEQTGFGPNSAVQKSCKLLETDKVDLVTGIVDTAVNIEIRRLFHNKRIFLIANQVGANVLRAHDHSPYIIHNSLDYWQANWALGHWAANHVGKKALVAASFYESGYDALYAFNLGFEDGGGKIIRTVVDNLPSEKPDNSALMSVIKKDKPDLVFASYSGGEAINFVKAFSCSDFYRQIPLLGSGFMVDETILKTQGKTALGIRSCFPWSSSLNQTASKEFCAAYRKKTGHSADAFAMLGFETARLIAEAVNTANGNLQDSNLLRKGFVNARFNSPRGQLKMNTHTCNFSGPLYLREVRRHGRSLVNEVIGELNTRTEPDTYAAELFAGPKTGWLNPYLCV
jgi:branched-chain amino acid transport system substrate-binding protein